MANEITLTASLAFAKGSTLLELVVRDKSITVTGTRAIHHRQTIGTTAEAIQLGEAAAGGYMLVVNRDPTNYVHLRAAAGETPFIRLRAGEVALFRLSSNASAPTAQADTASVQIEYLLIED